MTSELGRRMLLIVARRGYTGADREVFFQNIRGIRYTDLEKEVLFLEREGYITIEWVGPSNFTVSITPKGVEFVRSYQQDVWRKSAKALKELDRVRHAEKSIVHEEVGYSKMVEEKMGVEEVGELSNEILEGIDEHIMAERDTSSEEAMPPNVGVPAADEAIENEATEMETDVAERRISGEMISEETSEGEIIEPSLEYSIEEGAWEERIAVDEATIIEKRTKEKRISGEIDGAISAAKTKKVENEDTNTPFSEEKEAKAAPPFQEDLSEDASPPDFYQQIEDAIAFNNSSQQETESMAPSIGMQCIWETDRECPILKGKEFEADITLTPQHCVVCQLVEIKRLLKK